MSRRTAGGRCPRRARRRALPIAALLVVCGLAAGPLAAQELLTNGDFEAGLAGWTVTDLGNGTFGLGVPGAPTPLSGFPTSANAGGGTSYAVTDQPGPGTHALTQAFTVASPGTVVLTFEMFVNDQSGIGPIVAPVGLDHTGPPNQHARVDILTGAAAPFDTGAGVVASYYLGVDPGPTPNPYVPYTIDISADVGSGGTFQLRFAEVDNQFFNQMGVDNVGIELTPDAPATGAWGLALMAMLLLLAGAVALARRGRFGGRPVGA